MLHHTTLPPRRHLFPQSGLVLGFSALFPWIFTFLSRPPVVSSFFSTPIARGLSRFWTVFCFKFHQSFFVFRGLFCDPPAPSFYNSRSASERLALLGTWLHLIPLVPARGTPIPLFLCQPLNSLLYASPSYTLRVFSDGSRPILFVASRIHFSLFVYLNTPGWIFPMLWPPMLCIRVWTAFPLWSVPRFPGLITPHPFPANVPFVFSLLTTKPEGLIDLTGSPVVLFMFLLHTPDCGDLRMLAFLSLIFEVGLRSFSPNFSVDSTSPLHGNLLVVLDL